MNKDKFSEQSLMEKWIHLISRATECTEVYYIQVSIATLNSSTAVPTIETKYFLVLCVTMQSNLININYLLCVEYYVFI